MKSGLILAATLGVALLVAWARGFEPGSFGEPKKAEWYIHSALATFRDTASREDRFERVVELFASETGRLAHNFKFAPPDRRSVAIEVDCNGSDYLVIDNAPTSQKMIVAAMAPKGGVAWKPCFFGLLDALRAADFKPDPSRRLESIARE